MIPAGSSESLLKNSKEFDAASLSLKIPKTATNLLLRIAKNATSL
jgi:hypothetical protein